MPNSAAAASTPTPSPASAPEATVEKAATAKTTGLISLAIFTSRIMGLVRDTLMARFFSPFLRDCFQVAFRIPNMLRDLFAEGALSTAFVSVFSKKMKTEGDAPAWQLAHKMLALTTIFMSAITLVGMLLSGPLVRLMAMGYEDDKIEVIITLTRILFPFILLVSLAALVMGILNAKSVYGPPALASTWFNIVSIIIGFGGAAMFDRSFGVVAMIWISIGTLAGGLAQLASQLPALTRTGYHFKWDRLWRGDEGVSKILSLMWPSVIAGSAVQVNVLLNTIFATSISADKNGPVFWLGAAFRLMQLPLGIFGVAVATVTLPIISRAATEGINDKFRNALGAGNRLILFLCVPSAVGLFFLANPIISIIFEHGSFSAYETERTAAALKYYAIGLVFYSLIKVVQPAFTAIDKRFIPMFVAIISIVVNATLNYLFVFVFKLGHEYLALSTAIVAFLNCALLLVSLTKISGGLENRKLLLTLARLAVPLIALGFLCWLAMHTYLSRQDWDHWGFFMRAAVLGITLSTGGLIYMGLASVLKVDEAKQFLKILQRRIRR